MTFNIENFHTLVTVLHKTRRINDVKKARLELEASEGFGGRVEALFPSGKVDETHLKDERDSLVALKNIFSFVSREKWGAEDRVSEEHSAFCGELLVKVELQFKFC